MAKLKSQSQKYVELKEEDYLLLIENTIKMEALKIAGIEKMPIYKAMEHILEHEHIPARQTRFKEIFLIFLGGQ